MKIAVSVSGKEKTKGRESAYVKALVAVGVKPEELEVVTAADARRLRADDFDGVLFAGGEDVEPALYGEEKKYQNVEVNRARDQFEMTFLERALDRRLPILGICRGLQVINVKFGGTLYQDLASDTASGFEHRQTNAGKARSEPTHSVTVTDPDALLAATVKGSCRVNSIHHQAIKRLGRGLKVTAHSEDGLVEAVEAADAYPFLLAVQWHPEDIATQPEQHKIFQQFVAKCREGNKRSEDRSPNGQD